MKKKYDSIVYSLESNELFFEVHNSSFCIKKVQFSMRSYDKENGNKEKFTLLFLMDFKRCRNLCHAILSGDLEYSICRAEESGYFKGEKINAYTSYWKDMGRTKFINNGKKETKKLADYQKYFPWVKGNTLILKNFKIQKSNRENYDYVLRVEYMDATQEGKCAIKNYLQIPMTRDDMIEMAATLKEALLAYTTQYYIKYQKDLFSGQSLHVFTPQSQNNFTPAVLITEPEISTRRDNCIYMKAIMKEENRREVNLIAQDEMFPVFVKKDLHKGDDCMVEYQAKTVQGELVYYITKVEE